LSSVGKDDRLQKIARVSMRPYLGQGEEGARKSFIREHEIMRVPKGTTPVPGV
jgi:hypothetical protein